MTWASERAAPTRPPINAFPRGRRALANFPLRPAGARGAGRGSPDEGRPGAEARWGRGRLAREDTPAGTGEPRFGQTLEVAWGSSGALGGPPRAQAALPGASRARSRARRQRSLVPPPSASSLLSPSWPPSPGAGDPTASLAAEGLRATPPSRLDPGSRACLPRPPYVCPFTPVEPTFPAGSTLIPTWSGSQGSRPWAGREPRYGHEAWAGGSECIKVTETAWGPASL